jgi:hypothetical protein
MTFEQRINQFREEYEQIFLDYFNSYESGLKNLSDEYNAILAERESRNIYEAWEFSIFGIIKFKRPEENLHSPLLAELLNPLGSHGQKDTFYKLFIKRILGPNDSENFINDNPNDYLLIEEEKIKNKNDQGRIDITIKSNDPQKKFAIIIENKWDSGDSCFDQIYKYYRNYSHPTGKAYTDKNLRVIYLTKYGNDPGKVKDKRFAAFLKDKKGSVYFPISYLIHIQEWLEECIKQCQSPKVTHIIEQYLILLKYGIRN